MNFPYIVKENLSKKEIELWEDVYACKDKDRDRTLEEGLWRRTQSKENEHLSGWTKTNNQKKRLVHYLYRYGLHGSKSKNLVLKDFYIWIFYTLPKKEDLFEKIDFNRRIKKTSWEVLSKNKNNIVLKNGMLYLHIKKKDSETKQCIDYEFSFTSENYNPTDEIKSRPWTILKTGIREKQKNNTKPKDFCIKQLQQLLPAQVELGCGPSMENGIQPLHYLHDVYSVSEDFRTKKFILCPTKDVLLNKLLFDIENIFPVLTSMFLRSFETDPNAFYKHLKKMFDRGFFVGDIINNNFDLIPSKLALKEKFIRRFDEQHIVPEINFHPKARSLFVFGLHADRRKTQEAARKKGLKIVYIDTEGFDIDGVFYDYPLENTQKDDILYKEKAGIAIQNMYEYLNN